MKIIVCYKYVRDDEEISVNEDCTMNLDSAAWVISPYDLNAIQAAMRLAAAEGNSTVEVLTVGGDVLDNSKMRKAVLSRGPAKMNGVKTEDCGDIYTTAVLLKQAIEKMGDVDLVVCGEGSGDMYSQSVGSMLGALLNVPTLNAVESLTWEDGAVVAGRSNGLHVENIKITGKAVVSVTSDICPTHIPSMRDIMGAGKKPVEVIDAAELEGAEAVAETVSILAPQCADRMNIIFRESDEDGLDEFVKAIKKYQ
jgi:electron transfer flavoprotein beta subunit